MANGRRTNRKQHTLTKSYQRSQTKAYAFLTTGIFLLLLTAALLYLMANPDKWVYRFRTGTTTEYDTTSTTTTSSPQTTTITVVKYANEEKNGTLEWLEKYVFDLVNNERTTRGLLPLKWNEEIADVCKAHSKDMADNGFFSHTGSGGTNSSYRLMLGGIYYWNLTGENIAKLSRIDVYIMNSRGEIIETEFKSLEELAEDAVDGWMNSPVHRQNILRNKFDEAGMGLAVFNDSYYFTENFITRVACGYKDGPCCEKQGYLPWCYQPWDCIDMMCK